MPLVKGLLGVGTAGAGLGGLFASEEAEAAPVLKLLNQVTPEMAVRQLKNRLNKERQKGISPHNTTTDYIHNASNYDKGWLKSIKDSGEEYGGPTYIGGIEDFAGQMIEAAGEDAMVADAIKEWAGTRTARAGTAATAAAAAGAASAGEQTSPEIRGFAPWSDYEPEPSYLDRVTDPSTYANALRPYVQGAGWLANTAVGKHVAEQIGEAVEAAQVPGQAIHGLGRGVYGLATGESPGQAFSAGVDVAQNDLAENGALMKQWATDKGWHEDDAAAAGFATEFLADPLTYAGMGLLGKIGKAF